jgi:hypothetical protein
VANAITASCATRHTIRSLVDVKLGNIMVHKICKHPLVQVDEHYFSTLLAMQKRDLETDCKGGLVSCTVTRRAVQAVQAIEQIQLLVMPTPPIALDC